MFFIPLHESFVNYAACACNTLGLYSRPSVYSRPGLYSRIYSNAMICIDTRKMVKNRNKLDKETIFIMPFRCLNGTTRSQETTIFWTDRILLYHIESGPSRFFRLASRISFGEKSQLTNELVTVTYLLFSGGRSQWRTCWGCWQKKVVYCLATIKKHAIIIVLYGWRVTSGRVFETRETCKMLAMLQRLRFSIWGRSIVTTYVVNDSKMSLEVSTILM